MIETWLDYAPGDLVLFSEEVYRRLFARANAAAWPAPAAAAPLALAALAAAFRARRGPSALLLALAAGWAGAALAFLPLYEQVNWTVAWIAPLFWLQAAALAAAALWARPGPLRARGAGDRLAALAVAAALTAHPMAQALSGRDPAGLEVFAIAPDPTALATLAALALLGRRAGAPAALAALPLLWCLASAATLQALGAPGGPVLLSASLALAALTLARRRRAA